MPTTQALRRHLLYEIQMFCALLRYCEPVSLRFYRHRADALEAAGLSE
jgi:hypothetical protein